MEVTREEELVGNLYRVTDRLSRACAEAGRPPEAVTLVAVSKTVGLSDIAILATAGHRDFGEARDQEAAPKACTRPDLRWHFVGRLQANKARRIAGYAAVVHSVDRLELLGSLSRGAALRPAALPVLVQVSLDEGPGRGGVAPGGVLELADAVAATPNLSLAGVMGIAPLGALPRRAFAELRVWSDAVRRNHPGAVSISAGMSADLEAAVAEGATYVRVGTALFGVRPPRLG
ncbi:MAG: YggS family pyridoxal phosphate-dependent enzyme [Mycobacteriales bacterium]